MYARPVAAPLTWVISSGLASHYPARLILGLEGDGLAYAPPLVAYRAWRSGLRHHAGTST